MDDLYTSSVKNVVYGRFSGENKPTGNDGQREKKGPCADISQRAETIGTAKMSEYAS
jgi:hypothetical protein